MASRAEQPYFLTRASLPARAWFAQLVFRSQDRHESCLRRAVELPYVFAEAFYGSHLQHIRAGRAAENDRAQRTDIVARERFSTHIDQGLQERRGHKRRCDFVAVGENLRPTPPRL